MSLNLYPHFIHLNNDSQNPFTTTNTDPDEVEDLDDICRNIYFACKGSGTDNQRLLKTLGSCDAETRCKVSNRYYELYNEDNLKEFIIKAVGTAKSDFSIALQFLVVDPVTAECDMIIRACKGLGTNERLLFSILCGRSNKEMNILKKKFYQLNNIELEKYLDQELSGKLKDLMRNLLDGSEEVYDPINYHNENKLNNDIQQLYDMGQGRWGTDAKGLLKILRTSPPEYVRQLDIHYEKKYQLTLSKVLEKELSGSIKKAALYMIGMKLQPYEEIAKLIKAACRGLGTDELLLTCCLIRYQEIMKEVMKAHVSLFHKTVRDRIISETSGSYRSLLMQIAETGEVF